MKEILSRFRFRVASGFFGHGATRIFELKNGFWAYL